jgi:hypothetical protein
MTQAHIDTSIEFLKNSEHKFDYRQEWIDHIAKMAHSISDDILLNRISKGENTDNYLKAYSATFNNMVDSANIAWDTLKGKY